MAHFDANYGVRTFTETLKDGITKVESVDSWHAIPPQYRATSAPLVFSHRSAGACQRVYTAANSTTPTALGADTGAIAFDGASCYGVMPEPLTSSWSTATDSGFTAVWVGRFRGPAVGDTLLTLSRTRGNVDHSLYWSASSLIIQSTSDAFGVNIVNNSAVSVPAASGWMMLALVRQEGATSIALHFYTSVSESFRSWRSGSRLSSIMGDNLAVGMDLRTGDKFFGGELAVLLLYNRPLGLGELRDLAALYAERFGWRVPLGMPPPPPALKPG